FNGSEAQGDAFGGAFTTTAVEGNARDQYLFQGNFIVDAIGPADGFNCRKSRRRKMCAFRAVENQQRRSAIQRLGQSDFGKIHFAGSAPAAPDGFSVREAELNRVNLNLVFESRNSHFTVDAGEVQKILPRR